MEEAATTVPRFTHPLRRTIPVAGLTTPMVVTTQPRAGITHRLHGITSHPRAITTSRGFINRRHAITTTATRTAAGTVMTAGVGTAITGAIGTAATETAGVMIIEATGITVTEEAITEAAAITITEAVTVNHSIKKRRMKRRFFMPEFQYSDRSARGCRPSQTLRKWASTAASGTVLMSGQCQ